MNLKRVKCRLCHNWYFVNRNDIENKKCPFCKSLHNPLEDHAG